jgi:hypothetical protein
MAIGNYFSVGTNANTSSGGTTSFAVPITAAVDRGDLVVMLVAVDNLSIVQNDDEGAVISITDDAANLWHKIAEITCTQGVAEDGVVCSAWYCNPSAPLTSGNNATVNFVNSRHSMAVSIAAWPLDSGATGAVLDNPARSVVVNGNPDVLDVLTDGQEVVRLRAIASEKKDSALLVKTDDPVTPFDGVIAQATGGATSAVGIRAEYMVSTTEAAASLPGLFVADHASIYVAFEEVPPIAGNGALEASPSIVHGTGISSSTGPLAALVVTSHASVQQGVALGRAAVTATGGGQAHKPWKFFAGDTWLMGFTCVDQSGVPYNITQASALEWKLDDATRAANLFTLELGAGVTITDPLNGGCAAVLSAAQTATLTAGNYTDQLRLTLAGVVMVQSFGVITVTAPLV